MSLGQTRSLFAVAGLAASLCVSVACRPTPAAPPAAPPVSPDTWAVVDGRAITRDMVEKAYRRVADVAQTPSEEEAFAARLTVLNDLILQDLLAVKARALQIEVPDSEVEAAVAEARKAVPNDAFDQELARRNLTQADVRESLRRDLLSQKVIEREVTSKIGVPDQEVTAFFNANRSQFDLKEDAHRVAQIVITPVRDASVVNRAGDDAATPEAATAKLEMLMGRLKAGTAFSELAADYSEDPESAPRGGDMGLVPASQLRQAPPALRDAVLKAEPGTVNVVSSSGGHIIVLVLSHEKAGQRDLANPEVRTSITDALRARKEQLLRVAYLAVVRNEATVENHLARRLVENRGTVPSLLPTPPGR